MYLLITKLASQGIAQKKFLAILISVVLLFAASALYSVEPHYGSNPPDAGDSPKSFDYLLYPNSGPSVDDVLLDIQTRFNNNEKNNFTVILTSGTYSTPLYVLFGDGSSLFSDLYIEIRGVGTSVQIPGDNLVQMDSGNLHCRIVNLSISGGYRGIAAYTDINANAVTFLELYNCRIFNNTNPSWGYQTCMDGTGVYANGPTEIRYCDIYNNIGYNWVSPANGNCSRGGGIAIVNDTPHETIISNCNIYSNEANAGGGIYVSGSAPVSIVYNKIYDNTRKFYVSGGIVYQEGFGEGVYCYECDNITFANNIVTGQIPGSADYRDILPTSSAVVFMSCGYSQSATSVVIENNSFMDNDDCHGLWLMMPEGGTLIRNNISCGNKFGIYLSSYSNGYISLWHNDAYGNGTLNNEVKNYYITHPSLIVAHHNTELDPQVDAAYAPLWNSSVISWIIDAGDPDLFDSDDTPSDIGAIRASDHQYEEYTMPYNNTTNIKWMSFPVLNRFTNGSTTNSNFFEPIVNPVILDWVDWKVGNSSPLRMEFIESNLFNGNANVTSPVGYKVQIKNTVVDEIRIPTPGHVQGTTTVLHLYKYLSGSTTINENWLGYFLPESATPFEAFSPVLDKLTYIQTQYWSMTKMSNGLWRTSSSNPTINYGDMVVVKVSQDCSFSWENSQPVDPKMVKLAQNFDYTEKPEYLPMYIEFEGDQSLDLPSEIGIYVNGICKGATVVEGADAQICVYLDANEQISAENSELVFWYNSKAQAQNRMRCKLTSGSLSQNHDFDNLYYSFVVSDKTEFEPIIPLTKLNQNYPNPFNPTTTIAYELAEAGLVSMEIYNLKGQKVTTLLNDSMAAGTHRVVWNGTDKYGRAVSSGIYYCRLITKDRSISKKMILLK